jgi:hypothetical protein
MNTGAGAYTGVNAGAHTGVWLSSEHIAYSQ